MNLLIKNRSETPGEKWVIFSQFTTMLEILEIPLSKEKFQFRRYDGSLSNHVREKNLEEFKSCADSMVLLISLKCGMIFSNYLPIIF